MALERRMFSALDLRQVAGIIARLGTLPGVPTTDWCLCLAQAVAMPQSGMEVRAGIFAVDEQGHAGLHESCKAGVVQETPARELVGREYDEFYSDVRNVFSRSHKGKKHALVTIRSRPSLYGLIRTGDSQTSDLFVIEFRFPSHADLERAEPLLKSILSQLETRVRLAFESIDGVKPGIATPAEHRVLEQIILGLSIKEIAEELDRSPHTIHDHLKSLHRKFQAKSRCQLITRVLGYGGHLVGNCAENDLGWHSE